MKTFNSFDLCVSNNILENNAQLLIIAGANRLAIKNCSPFLMIFRITKS